MTAFTETHTPQLHLPEGVRLEILAQSAATAPRFVKSPILRNEEIAPEYFLMRLRGPEIARGGPGQFVMIRPTDESELHPLLPRPMAVYRYYPALGEFEIVYRVIGAGTKVMSERAVGEIAEVVGPVGRAFEVAPATAGILLVGRGIGICSITALADLAQQRGLSLYALLSGRNPRVVIGADLVAEVGGECCSVNDQDGTSEPTKIQPWMEALMRDGRVQQAYVCGANRLIKLTGELAARYGVDVQVSLESHMACGLGYCHGCATGAFGQTEESPLVCKDGPVFRCQSIAPNGREDRATSIERV